MAAESLEDPARRYAVLFPDGSIHVHADAGSMSARTQAQLETAIWNASAHPNEGLAKVASITITDLRTENQPTKPSEVRHNNTVINDANSQTTPREGNQRPSK